MDNNKKKKSDIRRRIIETRLSRWISAERIRKDIAG